MSMDMLKGTVYIGDSAANIHILDINKEFNIIRTYKTEHTNKISGIRVTPGSIITSSADSTVRISSPTDPPRQFTILQCRHGDIAGVSFHFFYIASKVFEKIIFSMSKIYKEIYFNEKLFIFCIIRWTI